MNLEQLMNIQIANWNVLYTKLHRFHWYVKGPMFFTLHEKFEELYNEAGLVVDQLAERLLAVGGQPAATMKEYLEITTLKESAGEAKASEMVSSLVRDYKQINKELEELSATAEESQDVVTGDLAVELREKVETHLWMLNSFLAE